MRIAERDSLAATPNLSLPIPTQSFDSASTFSELPLCYLPSEIGTNQGRDPPGSCFNWTNARTGSASCRPPAHFGGGGVVGTVTPYRP
jgi:hypothetical protein